MAPSTRLLTTGLDSADEFQGKLDSLGPVAGDAAPPADLRARRGLYGVVGCSGYHGRPRGGGGAGAGLRVG
jgi:hypothetical protein